MSSTYIFGASARTWSSVISVLQVMWHFANFVFFLAFTVLGVLVAVENKDDSALTGLLVPGILICLANAFGLGLGFLLHNGVQQKRGKRIQLWLISSVALLAVTVILQIQDALLHGYKRDGILFSAGILVQIVFIAVVNVHRRELNQDASAGAGASAGVGSSGSLRNYQATFSKIETAM